MKDPSREKAFLKRYGKVVECDVEYNIENKEIKNYTVTIKSPKNTFKLSEFLKDGLTDYVLLNFGDKEWKYSRMIDGEISVADKISEEV